MKNVCLEECKLPSCHGLAHCTQEDAIYITWVLEILSFACVVILIAITIHSLIRTIRQLVNECGEETFEILDMEMSTKFSGLQTLDSSCFIYVNNQLIFCLQLFYSTRKTFE